VQDIPGPQGDMGLGEEAVKHPNPSTSAVDNSIRLSSGLPYRRFDAALRFATGFVTLLDLPSN
jgi:hypothetical protein